MRHLNRRVVGSDRAKRGLRSLVYHSRACARSRPDPSRSPATMLARHRRGGPHGDGHGKAGQRIRHWPFDRGPAAARAEDDARPTACGRKGDRAAARRSEGAGGCGSALVQQPRGHFCRCLRASGFRPSNLSVRQVSPLALYFVHAEVSVPVGEGRLDSFCSNAVSKRVASAEIMLFLADNAPAAQAIADSLVVRPATSISSLSRRTADLAGSSC
jgi:hypothetical protein